MAALVALVALPASAQAVLPGTNGRIVFVSGRDGANGNDAQAKLYLRSVTSGTGAGATGPTITSQAGQHRHPTWSPDRTKVAYARGDANCATDCDIFVLDLTDPGASPENITKTADVTEDRPAWSPDGTRIAYESEVINGSGQTDILVQQEPFGGLAGHLTNTSAAGAFEGKPAWTPDSETIYYAKGSPNANANIMKRPANGGNESVGVPDSGITEFQPSVSPDGTKVCFTLSNGGFNTSASILVADIANPASQIVISSSGQGDYNCTWSPDGTKIAYVTGIFTNGALVMRNADATGFALLEDDAGNFDGNPDWAPDGRPQCEDLEVATTVDTPISIPIACEDTGPAYERTQVRADVPADGRPTNGTTAPDGFVPLPGSITYTPNAGFTGTDTFQTRSVDDFAFGDRRGTVTVRVDPPGRGEPDGVINDFTFGKVKRNKKKGTAKLRVNVPNPGDLELARSKKMKPDDETADEAGREKLKVKPKRKVKDRLADKGTAKVKARVTYTPLGGDPNTKIKRVKLKLK